MVHGDGTRATFEGVADWERGPDGLRLTERGELRIDDRPGFQGERTYLWAEGLVVSFGDGRYFHTVPPEGGRARHFCTPDMYVVDYDFSQWPVFTTVWHVEGPRKSYRMDSTYTKL
tara:strand:- start:26 stop:373 length:348 start_codon:yes stop_codon:yes gene_type:complete